MAFKIGSLYDRLGNVLFPYTKVKAVSDDNGVRLDQLLSGLPGRNLLDNWDFRKPVNQRGASSYTTTGFTIDRWQQHGYVTTTVNTGYINISVTQTGLGLYQMIENPELYDGKEFTFSIITLDDTLYQCTGTINMNDTVNSWFAQTVTPFGKIIIGHNGSTQLYVFIEFESTSQAAKVKLAKLERGHISTLAYDAPANYGEELRKCQRYYVNTKISRVPCQILDSTHLDFGLKLPVPMRLNSPTISSLTFANWIEHSGKAYDTAITITSKQVYADGSCSIDGNIPIGVILTTALTTPLAGSAGLIASVNIALSADL